MKNIVIGTLAHVDAGKTTLSESMLYLSGSIRKVGRVDHKNTFLDFDAQERNRGITIYSKQAMFDWKNTKITLIDTPGHVDFSSEMERTLQVLDNAIIVINALDGIQVHTETIWKLLRHHQIPTYIFINKMDITHSDKTALISDLEKKLHTSCVDFTLEEHERVEKISLCEDKLFDEYMETSNVSLDSIKQAIFRCEIFPCYFGSALKMEGVQALLDGITTYTTCPIYPTEFGAKIYKITRDEQGNKLTHMKITGGSLKVKEKIENEEKVDQIRLYSGNKYQSVNEVFAGQVCAVKGLKYMSVFQGLGIQNDSSKAMLSSYLNYKLLLLHGEDIVSMYRNMLMFAEEDPQLFVRFHESSQEITIQLMGEIQIEVLKNKIKERFLVDVEFEQGSVVYKETIVKAVEGIGHYEPLRHYAEVHLFLEPLERNSGLEFACDCGEDILPRQWQRLVLSHLQEREHVGVLAGFPITDMKITLLAGKAHVKHTEGGDFRQATYRALRQGLKSTESILLEPFFQFRLELPMQYLSRAMHDLQMRNAIYEVQDEVNGISFIHGSAPVSKLWNYQLDLHAYTKGSGKLHCVVSGYEACSDPQAVIEHRDYDSERDLKNPTGSVFCAQGAGFYVPWNEVKEHMHIKACWKEINNQKQEKKSVSKIHIGDKEVERVMRMTYGVMRQRTQHKRTNIKEEMITLNVIKPICFIVDGYNIIHDWDSLKDLAKDSLDAARNQLIHYMSSFQGYKKCLLILVFDAYKVSDQALREHYNGSIHIIYTKTAQTADSYIERVTHELSSTYRVTVATSDALEQLIVSGQGANRMSARELEKEFAYMNQKCTEEYKSKQSKVGNRLLEDLRKLNES